MSGKASASRSTTKDANVVGKARKQYENNFFDPGVQIQDDTFPAQYYARPESERAIGLKQDYIRHLNDWHPGLNARYDVTQQEIDALVRRYNEVDLLNFEKHISSWFNVQDPTHQRLINELYPQYFERRLDQIEANLEVQRRIAHLRLLGPRNADDLRFAYFLETGVIEKPQRPVFETAMADTDKQRGLFNPYQLFSFQGLKDDTYKSFAQAAWGKDVGGFAGKKQSTLGTNAAGMPAGGQGFNNWFGQGTAGKDPKDHSQGLFDYRNHLNNQQAQAQAP